MASAVQPLSHILEPSENWDEDFEFQSENHKNQRRQRKQGHAAGIDDARKMSIASSAALEDWDAEEGPSTITQTENWDDDFEDTRTSPKKALKPTREESWDDEMDDEDDSAEFGVFAEREEDRTVTAKSRRAALKRLSSTPPPPVPVPAPRVPFSLNATHPYQQQPFPRSPTSSVFSVPNTVQTHHTYSSTTHLRPTSAFALIPPSPPIHKERERRRLRKKSRPKPQGMFELASIGGDSGSEHAYNRFSFSDDGGPSNENGPPPSGGRRAETPRSDMSSTENYVSPPMPAAQPPVPQTPTKGAALLSRIGSVKKWGVRRRRGDSTTPADVIEASPDLQRTPRPQSSMSSVNITSLRDTSAHAHHRNTQRHSAAPATFASTSANTSTSNSPPPPTVPPASSNWFFRASSAGSPHARAGGRSGVGGAEAAVANNAGSRSRSPNRAAASSSRTDLNVPATPSKLIKRKSLGFVQLRRGLTGGGLADPEVIDPSIVESPRKPRYAGLGLGRAVSKTDDSEPDIERPRRKSFSKLLRDRDKENDSGGSGQSQPVAVEKEEGSRGFMGSVRRLSLVGRHRRNRSGGGLMLSNVGEGLPPPLPTPLSVLPHSLPPLPTSSSQLSLRLPSSSSSHSHTYNGLKHGSLHDLPSAMRLASVASSQSQGSSIMPASTVSGGSSRHVSAQQTPVKKRRPSTRSTRSRTSDEGGKTRRSLSKPRKSIDVDVDVNFETQILQSNKGKERDLELTPKTPSRVPAPTPAPLPLLPPIELQPPSPPRTVTKAGQAESKHPSIMSGFDALALSPNASTSSVFFTPTSSPHPPSSPNKLHVSPGKSPGSQQSASLGRSTAVGGGIGSKEADLANGSGGGVGGSGGGVPPRRNSLGDLKIPARISQAQVGLRRDLGMVREFASNVEQLKELQQMYNTLVTEVQSILDAHAAMHTQAQASASSTPAAAVEPPRATSPSFFSNLKPRTRGRSNTNPNNQQPNLQATSDTAARAQKAYQDMAAAFSSINSKYRISWECADLLIELGGTGGAGNGSAAGNSANANVMSAPPTSTSAPSVPQSQAATHDSGSKRGRERAITLAGDESKPPPPAVGSSSLPGSVSHQDPSSIGGPPLASPPSISWRASTGRHDLSQRQLVLLREMLNNANATSAGDESHLSIPEESLPSLAINRDWRWGDARNSTITLPSEESTSMAGGRTSMEKKRRSGRLGMSGIRDMLRALKRHADLGHSSSNNASSTALPLPPMTQSTTSLSTETSSRSGHRHQHPRITSQQRRRAKTSTGPESMRLTREQDREKDIERESRARSPYGPSSFTAPKPSPRRPSLASIFRLGTKNRPVSTFEEPPLPPPLSAASTGQDPDTPIPGSGNATGEDSSSTGEEDWDRMDSASDLDAAARALGMGPDGSTTVRIGGSRRKARKGNSPYFQHDSSDPPPPMPSGHAIISKKSFNGSQASLQPPLQGSPLGPSNIPSRMTRLSNVEEHVDDPTRPRPSSIRIPSHSKAQARLSRTSASPSRPSSSKGNKTGSVRSMPPQLAVSATMAALPDPKLAMTPENIKPLLENAREVHARLNECIAEIRALIGGDVVSSP